MTVVKMSDELVEKIVAESPKTMEMRKSLELKKESLMKGLETCRNIFPGLNTGMLFPECSQKAHLTLGAECDEGEDA
jgi:hypothetical protein